MNIQKTAYCNIYDDVLDVEEQLDIQEIINSKKIKYMFCDYSVGPELQETNQDKNCQEHPQYSAMIIENNEVVNKCSYELSQVLRKFLQATKYSCSHILRMKLNIQEKADNYPSSGYLTPHIDLDQMHNVLIYYPFDSDGNTLLFEKQNNEWKIVQSIQPKQGRFILFSGDQYHSGQPPVNSSIRAVLNIDFV